MALIKLLIAIYFLEAGTVKEVDSHTAAILVADGTAEYAKENAKPTEVKIPKVGEDAKENEVEVDNSDIDPKVITESNFLDTRETKPVKDLKTK